MAKRSPILGYNHNVRYRGLVFHVQTEDSGVLSPHLFTHLFHQGVIVSTRKLVYDAGASEEAIKALMQAQHKAVLKDLKLHAFDDKIDAYLGTAEGLEPRARGTSQQPAEPKPVAPVERESAATMPDVSEIAAQVMAERHPEAGAIAPVPDEPDATEALEARGERVPEERAATEPTPPAIEIVSDDEPVLEAPAERPRGSQFLSMPPPDAVPSAVDAGPTVPTPAPRAQPSTPPANQSIQPRRHATPPPIPPRTSSVRSAVVVPPTVDSSPEIEIIRPEESGRIRAGRDTDVNDALGGVPSAVLDDQTRPSDGIPGRIGSDPQAAPPTARSVTPSRPASHAASALPPMRPPSRPSITPPPVSPRPTPSQVEVALPPPAPDPSGFDGPTERERPGTYSIKGRGLDAVSRVAAVPAGLARPRADRASRASDAPVPPVAQPAPAQPQPVAVQPATATPPARSQPVSQPPHSAPVAQPPSPSAPAHAARSSSAPETQPFPRAPISASDGVPLASDAGGPQPTIPTRAPHFTAPIASRTPGGGNATPGPSVSPQGNVVRTRPAVIVGAPPKPAGGTPTQQRIRKAREDEGRGFGQGLISEKSLDEVILAYLSEDADNKK